MGFGFGMLFLPLLLLSGIACMVWILLTPAEYRSEAVSWIPKLYGLGFLGLLAIFLLGRWNEARTAPVEPSRADINGVYIVDTNIFSGFQSRWQYEHHRIIITEQDSLILEVTDKNRVVLHQARAFATDDVAGLSHCRWHFKGSANSVINHIIVTEPTMVRKHDNFYYVFASSRYGNMFFRKE